MGVVELQPFINKRRGIQSPPEAKPTLLEHIRVKRRVGLDLVLRMGATGFVMRGDDRSRPRDTLSPEELEELHELIRKGTVLRRSDRHGAGAQYELLA